MLNQRGFIAPILIWVAIGLIAIVAASKTGNEDKGLPNNQVADQQLPRTTTQPNPVVDPQILIDIVNKYYSDISVRQFDQAWRLLSKNFQNYAQGYDHFVKGYDTTKSILVQDTHIQDLSTNTIFIKLQSTDDINNQIQTRNYSGTWKLIKEDGSWKLDTANIALLNVSPSSRASRAAAYLYSHSSRLQIDDVVKKHPELGGSTSSIIINNIALYFDKNSDKLALLEIAIQKFEASQSQVNDYPSTNQSSDNSAQNNGQSYNLPTPLPQGTSYNNGSGGNKSLKYNPYNSTWDYAGDDESLKYNAFENQWEYVSGDETTKYNAFEDKWEYAGKNESTKYNPYENTWEYADDDSTTKYNPYESKWETTSPDSTLKYNPMEGTWSYE